MVLGRLFKKTIQGGFVRNAQEINLYINSKIYFKQITNKKKNFLKLIIVLKRYKIFIFYFISFFFFFLPNLNHEPSKTVAGPTSPPSNSDMRPLQLGSVQFRPIVQTSIILIL